MFRKTLIAIAALVALATPVSAGRYYDQGGVIPGSADDYHFVYGRGWVRNHHGGGQGYRGGVQARPFLYSYPVVVPTCTRAVWVQRGGVTFILGYVPCR